MHKGSSALTHRKENGESIPKRKRKINGASSTLISEESTNGRVGKWMILRRNDDNALALIIPFLRNYQLVEVRQPQIPENLMECTSVGGKASFAFHTSCCEKVILVFRVFPVVV